MPVEPVEYPPGYQELRTLDPQFLSDYETPGDRLMDAYVTVGIIALGAFAAVGVSVVFTAGEVGSVITAGVADSLSSISVSEAEALIAEEMLASGGTAADVELFIFNCAKQRALNALMSEVAATELASAEAAYVILRAEQNASTVTAGIIEAAARVNEQQALGLFFASGLGHF